MTPTTRAGGNAPVPGPGPSAATRTFLFTDIEGSTRRWEAFPVAMSEALARHDALLRAAIEGHGGTVFKTVGDAFCAVFAEPAAAVAAAVTAQRGLLAEDWSAYGPDFAALRVRTGIHTGSPDERGGDYFGPDVNRVARLMACGHGGQILVSGAVAGLVADALPAGCALRDLGERRLKDLRQPERVFQVVAPDLPGEFPPLATLDARPNNLPVQPTSLVGRAAEVADLVRLLRDEAGPRLVTLTGTGGTGKTRLALQAAAELVDDFDHGVWFVDLSALSDAELVPMAVASALAIPEQPTAGAARAVIDWLRGRRALVVLDNFEQVLPAGDWVADALAAAPGSRFLVTSRAALRLRAEHEVMVPPLPIPVAGQAMSLDEVSRCAAVELFVQRAAAVRPGFAVDRANAPAIAQICARLDGLPLAIELAAAWVKLLSPAGLLARLDTRLKLLTTGPRDLPARQRTLRDTIAWSHDLLSPTEQALFRRLAVFSGGATVEAIAAVCGDDGAPDLDTLQHLGALVDKSLLRQRELPDGCSWLDMLETIREFAADCLAASGEEALIRDRHLEWCIAVAEPVVEPLPADLEAAWQAGLKRWRSNLRAALDWGLHSPAPERRARGLALAAAATWSCGETVTETSRWLDLARRASADLPPSRTKAMTVYVLANTQTAMGRPDRAEPLLLEARELFHALGDDAGVSWVANDLGVVAMARGDLDAAEQHFRDSVCLKEAAGRPSWDLAIGIMNLGDVAAARGDHRAAISANERALAIYESDPTAPAPLVQLYNLAALSLLFGERVAAAAYLSRAARLVVASGISPDVILTWFAALAADAGENERAARLFGAADQAMGETGLVRTPLDREVVGRFETRVRQDLGDAGWAAARGEGQAMDPATALAYALERGEPEAPGGRTGGGKGDQR